MFYYFMYFERFIYSELRGDFFFLKENHFILSSKQNSIYDIVNKISINFVNKSKEQNSWLNQNLYSTLNILKSIHVNFVILIFPNTMK